MRFYVKPSHKSGDTREITKFALFPIYVNGVIYWLEKVTIHQTYIVDDYDSIWHNDYVIDK